MISERRSHPPGPSRAQIAIVAIAVPILSSVLTGGLVLWGSAATWGAQARQIEMDSMTIQRLTVQTAENTRDVARLQAAIEGMQRSLDSLQRQNERILSLLTTHSRGADVE